jgi:hypothetical protein
MRNCSLFGWHGVSNVAAASRVEDFASEIEALLAEPPVEAGALSLGALESSLIRRGIVPAAAIEDADGYDEGRTRDAILAVFEDMEQAIDTPQATSKVEAQP